MTDNASVKLDVTVTYDRGRRKDRRWTATYGQYPNDIEAEGSSAAEAKTRLLAAIVTAIRTVREGKPAFARDDDGTLCVAVPAYDGGCHTYRVNDHAKLNSMNSAPSAEAFTNCYHMTPIPERY